MSTNTILASAPLTSTGYHLKANGTTLGNSLIWDNGTNVGIGNQGTTYGLEVTGTVGISGITKVLSSTASTSRTTGALVVTGGLGIGGALFGYDATFSQDINSLYGMAAARNGSNTQGSGPYFLLSNAAYSQLWYQQLNASNGLDFWYNGSVKLTIASTGAATFSSTISAGVITGDSNSTGVPSIVAKVGSGGNNGTFGFGNSSAYIIRGGSDYGAMIFDTASTERMRITSGGITQINGTNGAVRLTLQNTDSTAYLAFTEQEIRMWRPNGSGADFTIATQAISGTLGAGAISFCPWNVEQMRIVQNGNINFNTTVYNNTAVATTRTLYIGSDFRIGGLSSIRASKKNIENVSNINWLYELNPVTFNYRKKDEEGNYTEDIYKDLNYGLIAEDTQLVADFLINYNEKDGAKEIIGIEYPRLIIPMLKAIQELKAEIDELKNK